MISKETRAIWNEQCRYTDHYVALLDILGFSTLVNNEELNSVFAGILGTIETLPFSPKAVDTCLERVKTAIISDTIVISAPTTSQSALVDIFLCIRSIFLEFLSEGIFMRGAICRGKLFHQGNIVFGPALVEAHRLEQKIAIYPRIIAESTMSEIFRNGDCFYQAFIIDSDEIPYLDLYRELILNYGPEYIEALRKAVYTNLTTNIDNTRIHQKYLWVQEHFNSSVKEQFDNKLIDDETYKKLLIL